MKKNQYIAPELKQRLTMELELPIAQSLPVGESEITKPEDILLEFRDIHRVTHQKSERW